MNARTITLIVSSMLLTMAGLASAAPGAPDFSPAIYGDFNEQLGFLKIETAHRYFQCPLLPVK